MFDIQNSVLVKYSGNERNVVIPDGVTEIADDAFCKCDTILSVSIPEGVVRIGENAFAYCKALKSVSLPQSLTHIGKFAFRFCTALKKIEIPKNVLRVEGSAFVDCAELSEVTWNAIDCKYAGEAYEDDRADMLIESVPFANCHKLRRVTIGDDVKSVPPYAFCGCKELERVTVGKSVTSIGESAFDDATNVKKVCYNGTVEGWCNIDFCQNSSPLGRGAELCVGGIPLRELDPRASVKKINSAAFAHCKSLRKISLQNCEYIDAGAFEQCTELRSVALSANLKKVSCGAFRFCPNLEKVYFDGDIEQWCNIDFDDATANPLSANAELYVRGERVKIVKIPKSVTKIKRNAFAGGKFACAIIHDGITEIASQAFAEGRRQYVKEEKDKYGRVQNKVHSLPCGEFVSAIFFEGDLPAWQKISVDSDINAISQGRVYMFSEDKPAESGQFWHYGEDGATPAIWE